MEIPAVSALLIVLPVLMPTSVPNAKMITLSKMMDALVTLKVFPLLFYPQEQFLNVWLVVLVVRVYPLVRVVLMVISYKVTLVTNVIVLVLPAMMNRPAQVVLLLSCLKMANVSPAPTATASGVLLSTFVRFVGVGITLLLGNA